MFHLNELSRFTRQNLHDGNAPISDIIFSACGKCPGNYSMLRCRFSSGATMYLGGVIYCVTMTRIHAHIPSTLDPLVFYIPHGFLLGWWLAIQFNFHHWALAAAALQRIFFGVIKKRTGMGWKGGRLSTGLGYFSRLSVYGMGLCASDCVCYCDD